MILGQSLAASFLDCEFWAKVLTWIVQRLDFRANRTNCLDCRARDSRIHSYLQIRNATPGKSDLRKVFLSAQKHLPRIPDNTVWTSHS